MISVEEKDESVDDMVLEKVRVDVRNALESSSGSHDWDHTKRVHKLCLHIGEKEGADMEVLELAAVLHDIGRPEQDASGGKICHAKRGAEIARNILEKHGLAKDKIEKIEHCIGSHRFRKDTIPQSREAKILFDADKLDAIGAVGIGRAFLFAGEVGAKLHNSDVDIEMTEEYTREDTAYREFMVKLRKVKDKMMTDEGKRLAEGRHDFMVGFFERIEDEINGNL
ncbi:MAG: HD domain-containing protein [Candidatus Woesearchaeota archaeon]